MTRLNKWLDEVTQLWDVHFMEPRNYRNGRELPARPFAWIEAGPWIESLDSLHDPNLTYDLAYDGYEKWKLEWVEVASEFKKRLIGLGVLPPSSKSVDLVRYFSSQSSTRDLVVADGDTALVAELDALCQLVPSKPYMPTLSSGDPAMSGVVETVIDWVAAGVVGNLAWHIAQRCRERLIGHSEIREELTQDEALAFARMYAQPANRETDLMLVRSTKKRQQVQTSHRVWEAQIHWTFRLVAVEAQYDVTIVTTDEEALPRLWSITETKSLPSRYHALQESGQRRGQDDLPF